MNCKTCGRPVNDGAKFCRECGSEIVFETESIEDNTCPECGNLLEENAAFCNNCGQKISEEYVHTDIGNRCPYCNSPLKDDALFCRKCGKSLEEKIEKSIPSVPKKKKDKGLVFLIVLLVVVLIASVSVIGYVCFQNNSIDIETPSFESSADENKEEGLDIEENDDVSSEETGVTEGLEEPEYIYDNFNVEDEVLRIRELYNATQSNLSSLTKDSGDDEEVKYYDTNSKLVRLDIPANSITPYTKYCYFENGELYFAFVFDGTKENRLYFKDKRLFRWIDESGKIHDKERSNSTFLEWEKIVYDDLNR